MAVRQGLAFPQTLISDTRKLPRGKEQALAIYRKALHHNDRREKIRQRTLLMEVVMQYLSVLDPDQKFLYPEFGNIILTSAEEDDKFDPLKAYQAFLALEYIVMLLVLYPWKYEFRTIKIYNGYFKVKISEHLRNVMCVFKKLGYQPMFEGCYQLHGPPDVELSTKVAFELFVCAMECKLILDVHRGVENEDFSVRQVVRCRFLITGGPEDTVSWLRHNYKSSIAAVSRERTQDARLKRERLAHSTPTYQGFSADEKNISPDSDYIKIKLDRTETEKSPPYYPYHTSAYQAQKRMIGGSVKQYTTIQSSLTSPGSGALAGDDATDPLMKQLRAEASEQELYDSSFHIVEEGTIDDHLQASLQTLGSDEQQEHVGDAQKEYKSVYRDDPNKFDNKSLYYMEQTDFTNVYMPKPINQGVTVQDFSKQQGLSDLTSQEHLRSIISPESSFEPVSLLSRGVMDPVDWQNVPFMDKMPGVIESPQSSLYSSYAIGTDTLPQPELLRTRQLSKSEDFGRKEQTQARNSVEFTRSISEQTAQIHSSSLDEISLPSSKWWICVTCTLRNSIDVPICTACGKTRTQPPDLRPAVFSRICNRCTYENRADASVCTLCDSPLEKYETVV